MTYASRPGAFAALLLGSWLGTAGTAAAFDLNGAWASSADQCDKVFTRQGGKFAFTENSDVYGGGFIVDGDQMIGKAGRCKVKARKDNGDNINLVAACATDIMLSSVQFSVKVLDANSLVRTFPGLEDLELRYQRCPSS